MNIDLTATSERLQRLHALLEKANAAEALYLQTLKEVADAINADTSTPEAPEAPAPAPTIATTATPDAVAVAPTESPAPDWRAPSHPACSGVRTIPF